MKIKKAMLKIRLKSDLSTSDGTGYNTLLDQDVCHDSYGFPQIPGKRLKGCLRESAAELMDWGYWEENPDIITKLFGAEGDAPGCIQISSAKLENYEKYKKELDSLDKCFKHPEIVLRQFSYIRTQTAIDPETGTAKEGLRSIRVVKKGCVFKANVTICADDDEAIDLYENALEMCCKNMRRMGCNRTRGLGEVEVVLEKKEIEKKEKEASENRNKKISDYNVFNKDNGLDQDLQKNLDKEVRYRIDYTLKLNSALMVKGTMGGEAQTLDYIPGSLILGKLAEWMTKEGILYSEMVGKAELICSNAYVSFNGLRFLPVAASLAVNKNNKTEARDRTELTEQRENDGVQLKNPTYGYIDGNVNEDDTEKLTYLGKNVKCQISYHHSRPADKSIGRAWSKDSKSQFYQISSISEGQSFKGFVEGSKEQIDVLYQVMKAHDYFRMGVNSSSEYGEVELSVEKPKKAETTSEYLCSKFVLKLEAPLLEYSNFGQYTTDEAVLREEVENLLGEGMKLKPVRTFYRYRTEGGYNRTWHLRKPILDAWEKGTVIVYQTENEALADIGRLKGKFLGERVSEGYGEISVYVPAEQKNKIIKEAKQKKPLDELKEENKTEMTACKIQDSLLTQSIYQTFARIFMENQAREQAQADIEKNAKDLALIQCLISMCREYEENKQEKQNGNQNKNQNENQNREQNESPETKQNTKQDENLDGCRLKGYLTKEIEGRYGDKTGTDKKQKREQAKVIIDSYNSEQIRKQLIEKYGDVIKIDEDQLADWYYMAYLIETKYLCRAKKEG